MDSWLTGQQVWELIAGYRFHFNSEANLQVLLERHLKSKGIEFEREVRLSPADRIDFMIGRVGLEVKVDMSTAGVIRQLHRYAGHDAIAELVLVTRKSKHAALPEEISGKKVHILFVGGMF